MSRFSLRGGFTLIEVLMIVVLVAVTSGASLSLLDGFITHRAVDLTVKEIEAVISDVRQRSVAQQGGVQWGIHFVNASTSHYYEIFSGSVYATTSQQRVELSSRVRFGQPQVNTSSTVIFLPVTGNITESFVITIIPRRNDPYVGIISLSTLGRMSREIYEGMIGYWKFDVNNPSSTADVVGLGGTAYGDNDSLSTGEVPIQYASGTTCKSGSCLYLDSYFLQGDLVQSQSFDKFSVVAWVRLAGNGNYGSILTGLEGTKEWFDARFQASSRKVEFRTYPSEELTNNDILDVGTWYHLAYVYDGAYKRIYLDGVQVDSQVKAGLSFTLDGFDIGRSEEKDNYLLQGYIDELRLFNRGLSASQILADYNKLK